MSTIATSGLRERDAAEQLAASPRLGDDLDPASASSRASPSRSSASSSASTTRMAAPRDPRRRQRLDAQRPPSAPTRSSRSTSASCRHDGADGADQRGRPARGHGGVAAARRLPRVTTWYAAASTSRGEALGGERPREAKRRPPCSANASTRGAEPLVGEHRRIRARAPPRAARRARSGLGTPSEPLGVRVRIGCAACNSIEIASVASRCCAPSCRSRSSRRRSASPVATMRARIARRSSSRAWSSACRRSLRNAKRAESAIAATTSGSSQQTRAVVQLGLVEHRHRRTAGDRPALRRRAAARREVDRRRADRRRRAPSRARPGARAGGAVTRGRRRAGRAGHGRGARAPAPRDHRRNREQCESLQRPPRAVYVVGGEVAARDRVRRSPPRRRADTR